MPIFHPHVYSNSGEIPSESHKDILVYLLPKKRRNSVAAKPVWNSAGDPGDPMSRIYGRYIYG